MSQEQLSDPGKLVVSKKIKVFYSVCIFLGLLTFGITVFRDAPRAMHAFVVGFFYFVTLALGGLFFTAIHHVTKAGWSVNIRRITESYTSFLVPATAFAVLLMATGGFLFEWLHPEEVLNDAILKHKRGYLNQTFWWIRTIIFFVGWVWFAKVMVGRSLKQDESGDESLTHKNVALGIAFIVFFALSYTLFSIDTIMALQPHWFSTIFGVYTFAGLFQSTMAFTILIVLYLLDQGYLRGYVTIDHVHDLGKFMFGFTVFWAYIAFSQYMLIWYANLPEESFYYLSRSLEPWVYVSVALLVFKFVVPFFMLLPRWAKRTPSYLKVVCYLILIMQFVDVYWLVYPAFNDAKIVFGLPEILIFGFFLGVFLLTMFNFLSKNKLVASKDPRAHESHHHHVVY